MTLQERLARYEAELVTIPSPGSGCHPRLLAVANLGIRAGLAPERIEQDLRTSIPTGSRRVSDREIRAAVSKAAAEHEPTALRDWRPARRRAEPEVDGKKLREEIMRHGSSDMADLWEASSIRLLDDPAQDAAVLLRALYDPSDFVFIGGRYDKQVQAVSQWLDEIKQGGAVWPHIVPNVLDGEEHETSTGSRSYRCDAAVVGFRCAVVEFDTISLEEQTRFWTGILARDLFPVAAIIHSGSKSLHGWIRVSCHDRDEWERQVEQDLFARWLSPVGVDAACRNESRLSRLPGHFRVETKSWQRLLYLNPRRA